MWLSKSAPVADSTNTATFQESIGNKSDAATSTVGTTSSLMKYIKGILGATNKIDGLATDGLSGTVNSLAYRVHELEKHFHSAEEVYGLSATNGVLTRKSITPIITPCGAAAWGNEQYLGGSFPESGTNTKVDINKLYVTAVGTANRPSVVEFWYGQLGTQVTAVTLTNAGDLFTKAGHGVTNDMRIVLNTIAGGTANLNAYTVYYVVNMSGNDFQVSLTSGGAAVVITADGSCNFHPVTSPTLLTETIVSKAAVTSDNIVIPINCPRIAVTSAMWTRGWAAVGANDVTYFISAHKYIA